MEFITLATKVFGMDKKEYYKKCKTPSTWFWAGQQMYNAAVTLLDIWTEAINKSIPRIPFSPTIEELNAVTEHLSKCFDLFPVYIMLMGYALENLSKGLEIMEKTKPGAILAGRSDLTLKELGVGDHKTLERLDRLKISLSPEEKEAVQIAVDHVIWAGRYGIPKIPGEHEASEDMSAYIVEWRKYADALNPLFNRLHSEYRERAFRYFRSILG
jgi:hypothetical protein